jgi:hypothetical protein
MKKIYLKSSLTAAILTIAFSFSGLKEGKLPNITKPYLGGYECKSAQLGDTEYLDGFSYITLELKKDNTFVLYYCPKDGEEKRETGNYIYDINEQTVTFSHPRSNGIKRKFKIENGAFCISVPIGMKTLVLHFEQK